MAPLFFLAALATGARAQGAYTVTGSDFQQKVIAESANQPVIVLFTKGDCKPCELMFMRTIQTAFGAFAGKAALNTVNIDTERELAQKLKVTSAPVIMVFKNGSAVKTLEGLIDPNPLFQSFAALAAPDAKQAYRQPSTPAPTRPPGENLKTIGSWTIRRGGDGVATGLEASAYSMRADDAKVGIWTLNGSATLSLRYNAETGDLVWDVGVYQDITRDGGVDRFTNKKVSYHLPGETVGMLLDGMSVGRLPDQLFVYNAAKEAARKVGSPEPEMGKSYLIVANPYFEMPGKQLTPKEFEKLFVTARTIRFVTSVENRSAVLSEVQLEDTQKAVDYLKGERTYAWRMVNDIRVPK